jgi:uncharacterized protein (DUF1501 family)
MKETRREFLIKSGCALTMTALATQMRHFGLMSAMAQKVDDETKDGAVPSDYRAMICIFLAGGNDGNNTVIPNHSDASISNYTAYFNARNTQGLAIAQASLLPIAVPRMGGLTYGLHPALGPQTPAANIVNNGIHELWGLGKMAIVTNCGTLVAAKAVSAFFAFRSGVAVSGRAQRHAIVHRLGRAHFRSANFAG